MLQLILLFCLKNRLWASWPPRASKAAALAPFLGSLGLPLASLWTPWASVWPPMGYRRVRKCLGGCSKCSRKGFQGVPKGFQEVPSVCKGVLKGSQGCVFEDCNCFPHCLGSRAGVMEAFLNHFGIIFGSFWCDSGSILGSFWCDRISPHEILISAILLFAKDLEFSISGSPSSKMKSVTVGMD
jgi:hypothetical protein